MAVLFTYTYMYIHIHSLCEAVQCRRWKQWLIEPHPNTTFTHRRLTINLITDDIYKWRSACCQSPVEFLPTAITIALFTCQPNDTDAFVNIQKVNHVKDGKTTTELCRENGGPSQRTHTCMGVARDMCIL